MKQRIIALCCAVSLVLALLTGCQTVGGLDPAILVENQLAVQSYEGSDTLQLELVLGETGEGYPDLTPIQKSTWTANVKKQDKDHTSMAGELSYGGGKIPFATYSAGEQIAIRVDGANKPTLMDGLTKAMSKGLIPESWSSQLPVDLSGLNLPELLAELMPSLLKYVPNPDSLTVKDEKVTIHGEALDLKKLHVELTGEELAALVRQLVENVLADEEGGTELIRELIKKVIGDQGNDLLVSIITAAIKTELKNWSADTANWGAFGEYLTASNTLKLDLYADADSQIRKSAYELQIGGLILWDGLVTGLKATGSSERWNINKPVTAIAMDTAGAVEVSQGAGMARFIKTLDKKSQAYQLFRNELKMSRKNIKLPPIEEGLPGETVRPYIDPDYEVTLVPVRFVTEKLDADVQWNGDTREVTVTDILSGKTLVFTIDSSTVLVDGAAVELEARAVLTGGSTYVPARFIAETFGAKVGWDGETRTVSIIRN